MHLPRFWRAAALWAASALCVAQAQSPGPIGLPENMRGKPNAPQAQQPAPAPQQQQKPAQTTPAQTPPAAARQTTPAQTTPAQTAPTAAQPMPAQNGPTPTPAAPNAAKPSQVAATPAPTSAGFGSLTLQNASLLEVIDLLARQLKINYILDPAVKGSVNLNTYGDTKDIDPRSLLELILRINGFAMIPMGDIYRIVPLGLAPNLPLSPQVNISTAGIPANDEIMLNLVFLKYASAEDVQKIVGTFIGEGAKTWVYAPANLLFILDSKRSMRRTMELIALFDNDNFAGQRIRNFEVKYSRPSDLAKELDGIFKAISLNEKQTPLKFLPLDRINTIVAIAANPAAFEQVNKWIDKLDVEVKQAAGAIDNYVYRVRYQQAEILAYSIMSLYGGGGGGYGAYGSAGGYYNAGLQGPYGSNGQFNAGGGFGAGGFNRGAGGGLFGNSYMGGTAPAPGGSLGGMLGAQQGMPAPLSPNSAPPPPGGTAQGSGPDQTARYLSDAGVGYGMRIPRVVPNPLDNSILIQGTPQEYQSIVKLLQQLDVSPRQVLIDARIYEVQLTGALSMGVQAYLNKAGTGAQGTSLAQIRQLTGQLVTPVTSIATGTLIGQSRELLAFLQTSDVSHKSKVISAPSVIATDSIPATIVVGDEVPTLSGSLTTASGGGPAVATSIVNRNTGVTLSLVARVNPSGVVTMQIQQEVSSPGPSNYGGTGSSSFSKRSVQTQVTVDDGDTIAIGGIMLDNKITDQSGLPGLSRLPVVGGIFGSKSYSHDKTELIIFFTPHVIYDTHQMLDATDELKDRLHRVGKLYKD